MRSNVNSPSSLKVGDVIKRRQVRLFAEDLYQPAVVVRVFDGHGGFAARLLKADPGEPDLIALEFAARGRTWVP